jgi:hypothetical protein
MFLKDLSETLTRAEAATYGTFAYRSIGSIQRGFIRFEIDGAIAYLDSAGGWDAVYKV